MNNCSGISALSHSSFRLTAELHAVTACLRLFSDSHEKVQVHVLCCDAFWAQQASVLFYDHPAVVCWRSVTFFKSVMQFRDVLFYLSDVT